MIPDRTAHLKPYEPGEQPADREYIKLNANENPYPPSPLVKKALEQTDILRLSRYPDPDSALLCTALADFLNKTGGVLVPGKNTVPPNYGEISPDMIFCGNGSDEVLSFIFYAFFTAGKPLVLPLHTYSFYPVYAGFYRIPLEQIPLKEDFTLDLERMLAVDSCGVIFANPNAPTGISIPLKKLQDFLERCPAHRAVVIDEAYVDFGGESALSLLHKFKNLIIVRTFSKSMSFAGMRLGFALAVPQLVCRLKTVKNSFNHFPVDILCATAGTAACRDVAYYRETCSKIVATRNSFSKSLENSGWKVLPSSANFVFAENPAFSGAEVYNQLKKAGILIRHFNTAKLNTFTRITVGTEEDMAKLLQILKNLR